MLHDQTSRERLAFTATAPRNSIRSSQGLADYLKGIGNSKMKVLIIGAGPAGCALAHGLKKSNIDFEIFEKGQSIIGTRHWAFTLGWARPYLLKLLPLELGAKLNESQCDPFVNCAEIGEDRIVMYDGQTHKLSFTFPIPYASEINIRKLRELCASGLNIQYNKKFTHFDVSTEPGITIHFEDGSSAHGDIAVGVDGAGSPTRNCLLEKDASPQLLPFALMNFHCSYTDSQARYLKSHLHPLVDIAVHPSNHYIRMNILDMPDREDASTWTFQILTTWAVKSVEDYDNETDRVKRLKAHVKRDGWAEPYKSAIEWIPDETEVLRDQLKIWKPVRWENHGGRMTLCGDSAHAMTFHRGQGANNALYDSYCFVEAMKAVQAGSLSLKEAVDDYDEKILKRGAEEVQVSKTQTFFTHDWVNFGNSPVMRLGTKPSHSAKTEGC